MWNCGTSTFKVNFLPLILTMDFFGLFNSLFFYELDLVKISTKIPDLVKILTNRAQKQKKKEKDVHKIYFTIWVFYMGANLEVCML